MSADVSMCANLEQPKKKPGCQGQKGKPPAAGVGFMPRGQLASRQLSNEAAAHNPQAANR